MHLQESRRDVTSPEEASLVIRAVVFTPQLAVGGQTVLAVPIRTAGARRNSLNEGCFDGPPIAAR